jgi:CHAT domain-containing protein
MRKGRGGIRLGAKYLRATPLERAFFYVGARSVFASLWTASDIYTNMMQHFYHNLAEGHDEGRALQQAKLDLIEQFRDQAAPLFWAGFTLAEETSRPVMPARP